MNAVVVDIEGTVSPLSAVRDVLFPYARKRIAEWVREDRPGVAGVVAEVGAVLGVWSEQDVVASLLRWHDENAKHSPLKTLHGLIWERGFSSGELRGQVYPDVPPALTAWRRGGASCWVYSSGSVLAQRLWFSHSDHGDLAGHFSGHFDTVNAGPKQMPDSYRAIATSIGLPPKEILFLSDSRAELDAAQDAGWRTAGVRRPADGSPDVGTHQAIADFGELNLEVAS